MITALLAPKVDALPALLPPEVPFPAAPPVVLGLAGGGAAPPAVAFVFKVSQETVNGDRGFVLP